MNNELAVSTQKVFSPAINLAMIRSGIPVIKQLILKNDSDTDFPELKLDITSNPEFAVTYHTELKPIPSGQEKDLGSVTLQLSEEYFSALTDRSLGTITLTVYNGETPVYEEQFTINLLPSNEWSASELGPKMAASFVTPNNSDISVIISDASLLMKEWTGDPSMNGYGSGDPERVQQQAAAIFNSLQKQSIVSEQLTSGIDSNIKIRLCDTVLSEKKGSSMDLSLLYAACLEASGINSVLVLHKNLAYVCIWLEDARFPDIVNYDKSLLIKRVAGENRTMCVVDALAIAGNTSFDDALYNAIDYLYEENHLFCFVDINSARAEGINPLNVESSALQTSVEEEQHEAQPEAVEKEPEKAEPAKRGSNSDFWDLYSMAPSAGTDGNQNNLLYNSNHQQQSTANKAQQELAERAAAFEQKQGTVKTDIKQDAASEHKNKAKVKAKHKHEDGETASGSSQGTKLLNWESGLLDLSLRSSLLNFRPSGSNVHILSGQLDLLEHNFTYGDSFELLSCPSDWSFAKDNTSFAQLNLTQETISLINDDMNSKQLRSTAAQSEIDLAVKTLYRKARFAGEEKNERILYLALGFLKWFDSDTSIKPHYAPLILLPAEIVKKSANSGYIIRRRHEDALMNTALLEMLKNKLGVEISGLDPLPVNEYGIDLNAVFSTLRQTIMSNLRWEICNTAYLGVFPIPRFLLWKDLKTRQKDIDESGILKGILAGDGFTQESISASLNIDDLMSQQDIILPMSADSYQMHAIVAAGEGKSFILNGPPGTGKSRTIVNIIGNELAHSKKVLFVSEKNAALKSVQDSISKLGLSDFCLELYPEKASGISIAEKLKKASGIAKTAKSGEFEENAKLLSEQRADFNKYISILHKKQPYGLSLYDLISEYNKYENAKGTYAFDPDILGSITGERLKELVDAATLFGESCVSASDMSNNPLSEIKIENYSQALFNTIDDELKTLSYDANQCDELASKLLDLLNIESNLEKFYDYEVLADIAKQVTSDTFIPPALMSANSIPSEIDRIRITAGHGVKEQDLRRLLFVQFSHDILTADASSMLQEWKLIEAKASIAKVMPQKKLLKTIRDMQSGGDPIQWQAIPQTLERVIQYQAERSAVGSSSSATAPLVGRLWNVFDTDWNKLLESCDAAERIYRNVMEITSDSVKTIKADRIISEILSTGNGRDILYAYSSIFCRFIDSIKAMENKLSIDLIHVKEDNVHYLAGIVHRIDQIIPNLPLLEQWCGYLHAKNLALDKGLGTLVEAYENKHLTGPEILPVFKREFYKSCITYTTNFEMLSGFCGDTFEEKIKNFKNAAKKYESLSVSEIYARTASRLPDINSNPKGTAFRRAFENPGTGTSIRDLFSAGGELISGLCPCIITSPSYAAEYLCSGSGKFDLVVIDEASLMPAAEAAGVISRGGSAIIVGDLMQLEPSSLNMNNDSDEIKDEKSNSTGIMTECLTIKLPILKLNHHYTGVSGSPIDFSNARYYSNNLVTVPPVKYISGTRLIPVSGYNDKKAASQNRAEASFVVADIVKRLERPETAGYSIGVITFNPLQQILIEDMLNEVFKARPELEDAAMKCHEPLLIKTADNVQGDRRDVILISPGLASDNVGATDHSLGLLDKPNGWRRLNVAATRSRYEMTVYSSIMPESLDPTNYATRGAADFKAFLEFARDGRAEHTDDVESVTGLNSLIINSLRESGLDARAYFNPYCNIDVVVNSGLGIISDGPSSLNIQDACEREIYTEDLLCKAGWHIIHVRPLNWYKDSSHEMERIKAAAAQLSGHPAALYELPAAADKTEATAIDKLTAALDIETLPSKPVRPKPVVIEPVHVIQQPIIEQTPVPAASAITPAAQPETVPTQSETSRNAPAIDFNIVSSPVSPVQPTIAPQVAQPTIAPQATPQVAQPTVVPQTPPQVAQPAVAPQAAPQIAQPTVVPQAPPQVAQPAVIPQAPPQVAQPAVIPQAPPQVAQPASALAPQEAPQAVRSPANSAKHRSSKYSYLQEPYEITQFASYTLNSNEFCLPENEARTIERVIEVIENEGPVSRATVCKRVLQSFGIFRTGVRIEKRFDEMFETLDLTITEHDGTPFFWPSNTDPGICNVFRVPQNDIDRRSVEDLPPEEIACAACYVLQNGGDMNKDDLIKETLKIMGYNRAGSIIEMAISGGLSYGIEVGRIRIDKEGFSSLLN